MEGASKTGRFGENKMFGVWMIELGSWSLYTFGCKLSYYAHFKIQTYLAIVSYNFKSKIQIQKSSLKLLHDISFWASKDANTKNESPRRSNGSLNVEISARFFLVGLRASICRPRLQVHPDSSLGADGKSEERHQPPHYYSCLGVEINPPSWKKYACQIGSFRQVGLKNKYLRPPSSTGFIIASIFGNLPWQKPMQTCKSHWPLDLCCRIWTKEFVMVHGACVWR